MPRRRNLGSLPTLFYSRRTACAMLAVGVLGFHPQPAQASTDNWLVTSGIGLWNVAANWSAGVPTSTSDVRNQNANATINHDSGSDTINSFFNLGIFLLSGGDLTILHDFTGSGNVKLFGSLYGGGASNSTYNPTGATSFSEGLLSGWTITNAKLFTFSSDNNRIQNCVVNGGLDLSTSHSKVIFGGSNTFGAGNYKVGFDSSLYFDGDGTLSNATVQMTGYGRIGTLGNSTLTIDSNTTINAGEGVIQANYDAGVHNLLNKGTIGTNYYLYFTNVNGVATNDIGGIIQCAGNPSKLMMDAGSFVNKGSLVAKDFGAITVSSASYDSTGTVLATNLLGYISINPKNAYALHGTYQADNYGRVSLGGLLTRGDATLTTDSNGSILLAGALDNSASTFDPLKDVGGTHRFVVDGGAIYGGAIVNTARMLFTTADNRLVNVALDGKVDISKGGYVHFQGTTNFDAGTYIIGTNPELSGGGVFFDGDYTLKNTNLVFANNGLIGTTGASTLTIDATSSITGQYGAIQYPAFETASVRNVVNNGLISQAVANGKIEASVNGTFTNSTTGVMEANGYTTNVNEYSKSFINSGLMRADNESFIVAKPTTYTSTGMVRALNGGHVQIAPVNSYILQGNYFSDGLGPRSNIYGSSSIEFGGTFKRGDALLTTSNSGAIYFTGTLDNVGASFDTLYNVGGDGNVRLQGGMISGGSIVNADKLRYGNSYLNTLNNVTFDKALDLSDAGSQVQLKGTTRLISGTYSIGANSEILLNGDQTLDNVHLDFKSYGYISINGPGTLTVAGNSSITGRSGYIQSAYGNGSGSGIHNLINNGLISQDTGTGTFNFDGVNGTLTNNATGVLRSDGPNTFLSLTPNNFVNTGAVEAKNGGTVGLYLRGGVLQSAGAILAAMDSKVNFNQDLSITDGSLTVYGQAAAFNSAKLLLKGGTTSGTGTITAPVVNSGAKIMPGDGVGKLSITGSYAQTAGGSLLLEFGAAPGTPGASNDLLDVSSVAVLDGNLSVAFLNGYSPSFGDTFTIMNYASMTSANLNVFKTFTVVNGNYRLELLTDNPTNLKIRFAAVPGPESVGVFLAGFMGLTGLIRHRGRK